jgi:hypothetical protein
MTIIENLKGRRPGTIAPLSFDDIRHGSKAGASINPSRHGRPAKARNPFA